MRLLIGASIFGNSGYAKSMRELGLALNNIGVESKSVHPIPTGTIIGEKYGCLLSSQVDACEGDTLLFRAYFEPTPGDLKGIQKVAFIALESSKLPERMVREVNDDSIKQVWVPSNYTKHICIRSGIIEDKIRVIPHGYDPKIFKVSKKPIEKEIDKQAKAGTKGTGFKLTKEGSKVIEPYKFLFVGGYTGRGDRKGADLLAQAFHEEFNSNEKVQLVLKLNTTYGKCPVHDLAIDPRIKIDLNNYSDDQMGQIYNSCDIFVSPNYGEAFNMTVLEAMACGLPIITSASGEMDYLADMHCDRIRYLNYTKKVPARYSPWDCGSWYKPCVKHLKEQLRYMFENRPSIKKYKRIENWTWEKAALKTKQAMEELWADG